MELDDQLEIHEAERKLDRSRLHSIIDHPNAFLDRNDNVIVTFSPYNITELPPRRPWLEMSDHSIYGNGTKTFVVRINREEITKRRIKELDQKISEAQERVSETRRQYDAATEKLSKLLEQRDYLGRGLDGGRISLKEWEYTWQGHAVWDGGSVTVDCNYCAKMTFQSGDLTAHGKEIQQMEIKKPGFTDKDIIKALQDSLCAKLDGEFEDYCTEDDYYEPVVEDFEAEYYARAWAEERGMELISFEGNGSDEGYEPKSRCRC